MSGAHDTIAAIYLYGSNLVEVKKNWVESFLKTVEFWKINLMSTRLSPMDTTVRDLINILVFRWNI